jgi:hypothetical protein
MDFKLEDKQVAELDKLNYYQLVCMDVLNEFFANHSYQLADYEKENIIKVIKRLFEGEVGFLERSPIDYFDLYED